MSLLPPVEEEPRYGPLPLASRRGIGLCLSGGGYRATLFHLGALRRLNELGVLSRADFRTVSSVSGGSITAALLATALATRIDQGPLSDAIWDREVRDPLRAFTRRNIRTAAIAKRLLPWNWLKASTAVQALAKTYEEHLTELKLEALPERPDFVLCATDMAWGVNWIFTRVRMGDYQAGYTKPPADFPLARAVAASACFPPVFNPLPMRIAPSALVGGKAPLGAQRDAALADLRLTDGGDYDNMGLEPVWKSHAVVLVSDAGGLFTAEEDRGLLWRIGRYQGIQEQQARGLRKRWLISSYISGSLQGTYWGIGSARSRYGRDGGYSKALAHEVLAEIRTDLDAFSDAEAAILENHGYLMADAAIATHVPALLPEPVPELRAPHPKWCPPAMDEAGVRNVLAGSGRRTLLGRR
jgi:NTE family protein